AVKFSDRHPNGSEQIAVSRAVPMRMNQMRDDLGIGLRAKRIALRLQPLAQRFVVFDDAVVDDGDFVARQMRMRVVGGRRAVCRPTRMRDASRRMELARISLYRQIGASRRRYQTFDMRRGPPVD